MKRVDLNDRCRADDRFACNDGSKFHYNITVTWNGTTTSTGKAALDVDVFTVKVATYFWGI